MGGRDAARFSWPKRGATNQLARRPVPNGDSRSQRPTGNRNGSGSVAHRPDGSAWRGGARTPVDGGAATDAPSMIAARRVLAGVFGFEALRPDSGDGDRGVAGAAPCADRDADRLGQVAVRPGTGAGRGQPHGAGLAVGSADSRPGRGAQARGRRCRGGPLGQRARRTRGGVDTRGVERGAPALHGPEAADAGPGAGGASASVQGATPAKRTRRR